MSSHANTSKIFDQLYETQSINCISDLRSARTPLLSTWMSFLFEFSDRPETFEGGAGPGFQALLQAIEGMNVTVNEFSSEAIKLLKKNLDDYNTNHIGNEIFYKAILEGDVVDVLRTCLDASFDGIHLSSLLSFFTPDERARAYEVIWRKLKAQGILAIAFPMEKIAETEGNEADLGTSLPQLIVTDPLALKPEFQNAGLALVGEPITWEIDNYCQKTAAARNFVGYLLQRAE